MHTNKRDQKGWKSPGSCATLFHSNNDLTIGICTNPKSFGAWVGAKPCRVNLLTCVFPIAHTNPICNTSSLPAGTLFLALPSWSRNQYTMYEWFASQQLTNWNSVAVKGRLCTDLGEGYSARLCSQFINVKKESHTVQPSTSNWAMQAVVKDSCSQISVWTPTKHPHKLLSFGRKGRQ